MSGCSIRRRIPSRDRNEEGIAYLPGSEKLGVYMSFVLVFQGVLEMRELYQASGQRWEDCIASLAGTFNTDKAFFQALYLLSRCI